MDYLLYKLDNILVKYSSAKLWILGIISFLSVIIGALFLYVGNGDFYLSVWDSWTYLADPGTHVAVEDGYNRTISVLITIVGMLIFALLIGLISDIINDKFDALKNGKTNVYEENHLLILGWSDKITSLIEQINLAEKGSSSSVVLLSEKEKDEMEKYLFENLNTKNIICRNGQLDNIFDLKKVNIEKAKYILLLATDSEISDEFNLKVVLTIVKSLKLTTLPITVEIKSDEYSSLFQNLELTYPNLNIIYTKDSISRLLAQSLIYNGVTKVYNRLFDYHGDNFNIIENTKLLGLSVLEISTTIKKDTFCGIYSSKQKRLVIEKNYIYKKDDKLVILSNSKDTIFSLPSKIYFDTPKFNQIKNNYKLLIIGYNDNTNTILKELNNSVSYDIVIASKNNIKRDSFFDNYSNLKIKLLQYSDVQELINLDIDKVLITYDSDDISIIKRDTNVLSILMMLRIDLQDISIVSEIFDIKTMNLVVKKDANDYIISNELISKFLTSVVYSNEIKIIITELLKSSGNIIKIIDNPYTKVFYHKIYNNFINQNTILIGYIDKNKIILNPKDKDIVLKNEKLVIIQSV